MKPISIDRGNISIRVARELDLRSVVELKYQLDKHHELPGLWPPIGGKRSIFAQYRQMLRQRTARLFVAEHSSHTIVGYLTAAIQTRECPDRDFRRVGMIGETFVDTKHRRHGVGTLLVEAARRFLSSRGTKHVTLRNAVGNRLANEFWEELSFKPVLYTRTTTLKKLATAILEFISVHPKVAKTYRFDCATWERTLQSAVMIDYRELSEFGLRLASTLKGGRNIRITQGKSTDLSFEIAGRTPQVSDGVIDEADVERGQVSIALPSGTVAVAPLETTASGRVRFDRPIPRSGKLIQGMNWKFDAGRVVDFSAKQNLSAVKNRWDMATGDRDKIGSFILGVNPKAKFGFNIDPLVRGAVSIGIGENRHLGGKNNTDFAIAGTLSKATVELDGTPIVKNGKYVTSP